MGLLLKPFLGGHVITPAWLDIVFIAQEDWKHEGSTAGVWV